MPGIMDEIVFETSLKLKPLEPHDVIIFGDKIKLK